MEYISIDRQKSQFKIMNTDGEVRYFTYMEFMRVNKYRMRYYVPDPLILVYPESEDWLEYEAMVAVFSKSIWFLIHQHGDVIYDVVKVGYASKDIEDKLLRMFERGELKDWSKAVAKVDGRGVKAWRFFLDAVVFLKPKLEDKVSSEFFDGLEEFFKFCEVADI